MSGLIKLVIIVILLIAAGFGVSIAVTTDLDAKVADTAGRGLEEGLVQGSDAGWQEGTSEGYQEGGRIGYEEAIGEDRDGTDEDGFYFLYNPTYAEVQEILLEDASGSARTVNNYAETHGIRAAYVRCRLVSTDGEGKTYVLGLIGFETVDEGFVFFEAASHREVKLEFGKLYSEVNKSSVLKHDGIISSIRIIW